MLIWIKAAALWRADFGARGRGLGFTRQAQWTGRRIKARAGHPGVWVGFGDQAGNEACCRRAVRRGLFPRALQVGELQMPID